MDFGKKPSMNYGRGEEMNVTSWEEQRHTSLKTVENSLIITKPTNALIVCHLFLNNFLKHFHCSYMFR